MHKVFNSVTDDRLSLFKFTMLNYLLKKHAQSLFIAAHIINHMTVITNTFFNLQSRSVWIIHLDKWMMPILFSYSPIFKLSEIFFSPGELVLVNPKQVHNELLLQKTNCYKKLIAPSPYYCHHSLLFFCLSQPSEKSQSNFWNSH